MRGALPFLSRQGRGWTRRMNAHLARMQSFDLDQSGERERERERESASAADSVLQSFYTSYAIHLFS